MPSSPTTMLSFSVFIYYPLRPTSHFHSLISPPLKSCSKALVLRPPSGSDSSSSVGSSSGSLSRPAQLSLPGPVRPFTMAPAAPHPSAPIVGSAASQSSTTNSNINANASFYIVPLDASAIPPGSVLLNPQTGTSENGDFIFC